VLRQQRFVLENFVAAVREAHHAANLFFDVSLVPQFSHRNSRHRRIDGLTGEDNEFSGIVLVVLDQSIE